MNILVKALTIYFVIINSAWALKDHSCDYCNTAQEILTKVQDTQKKWKTKEKELAKHKIVQPNNKERGDFELAQGEAFRFVCDDNKNTLDEKQKIALMKFVLNMNKLGLTSDAIYEINGCFYLKVKDKDKEYKKAAKKSKLSYELKKFMLNHRPITSQDD